MSEQLLRTAQDSIDFLRRALIQRDADFCQQRTEIERLTAAVSLTKPVTDECARLAEENERLRAALERIRTRGRERVANDPHKVNSAWQAGELAEWADEALREKEGK